MIKQKLHIKFLKYLLKRQGLYEEIEVKDFLLKEFPQEDNFNDRKKMMQFLYTLLEVNLIKFKEHNGLSRFVPGDIKSEIDSISTTVRLTVDGFELLNKHNINKNNTKKIDFIYVMFIQ